MSRPHLLIPSLLLATILMVPAPVLADPVWTFLGLGGRLTYRLRASDGQFYAATSDGIFRKTVAGSDTTWTPLGLQGDDIRSLDIDGSTIVAGALIGPVFSETERRIYRSTDLGASWDTTFSDDFAIDIMEIARHPSHPDTIFAASYEALRSSNGGTSWGGTFGFSRWNSVHYQPGHSSSVWIGGEGVFFNATLYRSRNGGASWTSMSPPNPMGENAVNTIEFDPVDGQRVYLGMEGYIFRTLTGGAPWQQTYSRLLYYTWDIEVEPGNPAHLFAVGIDHAAPTLGIRLLESHDFGGTWTEEVFLPGPGDHAGYDLELIPEGDSVGVYVAGTGVFRVGSLPTSGVAENAPTGTRLGSPWVQGQSVVIPFELADPAGSVSISIFDVTGRLIRSWSRGPVDPGRHEWIWGGRSTTGRRASPGSYFARLSVEGQPVDSRKLPIRLR